MDRRQFFTRAAATLAVAAVAPQTLTAMPKAVAPAAPVGFVGGVKMWQDIARTIPCVPGSPVAVMELGTGWAGVQDTPALRPIYREDSKGRPYAYFDGSQTLVARHEPLPENLSGLFRPALTGSPR